MPSSPAVAADAAIVVGRCPAIAGSGGPPHDLGGQVPPPGRKPPRSLRSRLRAADSSARAGRKRRDDLPPHLAEPDPGAVWASGAGADRHLVAVLQPGPGRAVRE